MNPIFNGASKTAHVTLTSGGESVDITITRPPLLFGSVLDRVLPLADEDDPATVYRMSLRSVLWAAEGLRSTQDIPPAPALDAGEDAWTRYAEDVAEVFNQAGLLTSHIRDIASAAIDLNIGNAKKTNLTEALAAAGNA